MKGRCQLVECCKPFVNLTISHPPRATIFMILNSVPPANSVSLEWYVITFCKQDNHSILVKIRMLDLIITSYFLTGQKCPYLHANS